MPADSPNFYPDEFGNDSFVAQFAVEIDSRGRLKIPARLSRSLSWLGTDKKEPIVSLVVLDDLGRIILHDWDTYAVEIESTRRTLLESAGYSSESIHALRQMEDRYKVLKITNELRPTLNSELLLHLGISPANSDFVYLVRIGDSLEILSRQYRNKLREVCSELLSDLP